MDYFGRKSQKIAKRPLPPAAAPVQVKWLDENALDPALIAITG